MGTKIQFPVCPLLACSLSTDLLRSFCSPASALQSWAVIYSKNSCLLCSAGYYLGLLLRGQPGLFNSAVTSHEGHTGEYICSWPYHPKGFAFRWSADPAGALPPLRSLSGSCFQTQCTLTLPMFPRCPHGRGLSTLSGSTLLSEPNYAAP